MLLYVSPRVRGPILLCHLVEFGKKNRYIISSQFIFLTSLGVNIVN